MPNWSSTNFCFRGPEADLKDFCEKVRKGTTEDRGVRIIETLLPCPQELRDTTATTALTEIPEKWAELVTNGTWTQEQYDERVAENNKLLEQQKSNTEKYGAKDWYEWQYENWGVKWGDCDTTIDDEPSPYGDGTYWSVNGYFQTPWGTATQAWQKISEMFPTILFAFDSEEEAGFFVCTEFFQGGELLFEEGYAPCDYDEEVDWDDEDSVEKYEMWKEANESLISDKADAFLVSTGWVEPKRPIRRVVEKSKTPTWWK